MEISVSTYSLRHLIKSENKSFEELAGLLKDWNISNVEINNIFCTPENLVEVAGIFKNAGIKPVLFTIDGNNFFQKKQKKRDEQFNFMKKWVDPAAEAGFKMIRANMGRTRTRKYPKALQQLKETFVPILKYINSKGITFVFENHGGLSSDIDFQMLVAGEITTGNWGYLLDTGNYNPKDRIYENIDKLAEKIKIVHAKAYNFDENGNETLLDYARIIDGLKKIGFDGILSVEYEGPLPDKEGTFKTVELLRKYIN